VEQLKSKQSLGTAEPRDMSKKIWVAITAHNPLQRLNPLINVLSEYQKFQHEICVNIYVNYEAQEDVPTLESVLEQFDKLKINVKVASPEYQNWYLTWAHKTDLALAILNRQADFYIYQENDVLIRRDNFDYFMKWKPVLSRYNLEPGFALFENFDNKRVPIGNYEKWYLTKETPNVWHDIGFNVPKLLVVDFEIDFFVQLGSPYYCGMILDQRDGETYIRSDSYDPEKSYIKTGIRNWPIADRSSMGVAFENLPPNHEHRRCVPVVGDNGTYKILDCGLIQHDDNKYSARLKEQHGDLLSVEEMLVF
jgi:hypothetical protein